MKKILFKISGKERTLGLGDVIMIASPVYFRGEQLGYKNITLQWPNIVTGPNYEKVKCPKRTILPIKFIEKENIIESKYDKVYDLRERDALFPGYPGIDKDLRGNEIKNIYGIYNFNNLYMYQNGKAPIFNIKKNKIEKPYVILHHRQYKKTLRNSSEETTKKVFNILRELLKDKYEIWKMGEPTEFDYKFDKVLKPFNNNVNGYFKTINNASMVLGNGQSGITVTANFFNVPVVRLDVDLNAKITRNLHSVYYWSLIGGIGYTYYDWVDNRKNLRFLLGQFEENILRGFIKEWLL